jgi:hypothetical protein
MKERVPAETISVLRSRARCFPPDSVWPSPSEVWQPILLQQIVG